MVIDCVFVPAHVCVGVCVLHSGRTFLVFIYLLNGTELGNHLAGMHQLPWFLSPPYSQAFCHVSKSN